MAYLSRPLLLDEDGDAIMADEQPEHGHSYLWDSSYATNPEPLQVSGSSRRPPISYNAPLYPTDHPRLQRTAPEIRVNRPYPSFTTPPPLQGPFGNMRHLPPPQRTGRQASGYSTEPAPPSNLTSIFPQPADSRHPPRYATFASMLPGHMFMSMDGHQYMPTQSQPDQPPPELLLQQPVHLEPQTPTSASAFYLRTRDSLELIGQGLIHPPQGTGERPPGPPSPLQIHADDSWGESLDAELALAEQHESYSSSASDTLHVPQARSQFGQSSNNNINARERPRTPRPHHQRHMSRPSVPLRPCTACLEEFRNDDLINLACSCRYCTSCLNMAFRSGCSNMASFPPKCCGKPLRISVWGSMLEPDVLGRYKEIEAEFSANRPLYCAQKTCSEFIPDNTHLVDEEAAVCSKCQTVTCKRCRKEMRGHSQWNPDDRLCPADDADLTALYALGTERRWKQCPACLNMVERVDGCNHMDCVCGVEFCYLCGKLFDEDDSCDCDPSSWDGEEDRDDEEEDEEDEEEWPNFRVAVDALGRPTCLHWNTEPLDSGGEDTCHGCLQSMENVRSCNDCALELCETCLFNIQGLSRILKDTEEDGSEEDD